MSYHVKTDQAAKGKWRGILLQLGVPSQALTGRHTSCPMCGGKDRFRFDNQEGKGTWICNNCGAGSGIDLAIKYLGEPFVEVASRIDAIVGNVRADAPGKPKLSDGQRRKALRAVWSESQPVTKGDLVDRYLAERGLDEVVYPKALRFAPKLRDGEGGVRPCMVALVGVFGQKPVTLHRTFLRGDGRGKAEMAAPRKLMPGDLPDGACVQLSEWTGGPIGIAEGIETALAASALFDIPVWAAINAGMLKKWRPPEDAESVAVFADNDASFTGQAAGYELARAIAAAGKPVTVHVPDAEGCDWADVYAARHRRRFAAKGEGRAA